MKIRVDRRVVSEYDLAFREISRYPYKSTVRGIDSEAVTQAENHDGGNQAVSQTFRDSKAVASAR